MKAYVKVIYSSEGASPGEVERAFLESGFLRLKGGAIFEVEVEEDSELKDKLEKLHDALRGLEVRYMPSLRVPEEAPSLEVPAYRQRLESWRTVGIDVDELMEILERSVDDFRERAQALWAAQIERISDDREREEAELEAKRKLDGARALIMSEVEGEGKTYNGIMGAVDIDAEILSEMLDDLVEKGKLRAEQRGRKVVFIRS